ncbi:MAG: hypothetical protein E7182_01095 [Erysipelotrichaceae bacterium]|nr:hypothetical protein [Erysipelotrichaceae bacterium]
MEQVTLKIEGMHCSMCEAHVCDAIRRALPKAKKVKASHLKGKATFLLEEGVDFTPGIEAVKERGYQVLDSKKEPMKRGFFLFSK